jgi:hypothetical protein
MQCKKLTSATSHVLGRGFGGITPGSYGGMQVGSNGGALTRLHV